MDATATGSWASAPVTNGGFDFGSGGDFTVDAWIKVDVSAMSQRIGAVNDGRPVDFLRQLPQVDDLMVDLVGSVEAGVANREARVDEFYDSGRAFEVGNAGFRIAESADGEVTVDDGSGSTVDSLSDDGWISDGWIIAEKGLVSNNGWAFFLTPSNQLGLIGPNGQQVLVSAGSTDLVDGGWHMVSVALDREPGSNGLEGFFYVDGTVVGNAFLDGVVSYDLTNSEPVTIGALRGSQGYFDEFPGLIDEVEVFDRVVPKTELDAIYNAGDAGKCKDFPPPPPSCDSLNIELSWTNIAGPSDYDLWVGYPGDVFPATTYVSPDTQTAVGGHVESHNVIAGPPGDYDVYVVNVKNNEAPTFTLDVSGSTVLNTTSSVAFDALTKNFEKFTVTCFDTHDDDNNSGGGGTSPCSTVIDTMGAVAYWPFDEKINGAYPEALTGNPDWAAQQGSLPVDTVPGQIGNAAKFGPSANLILADGPATADVEAISTSFWYRPDTHPTNRVIMAGSGTPYRWSLVDQGNSLIAIIKSANNAPISPTIPNDSWTHIAVSMRKTTSSGWGKTNVNVSMLVYVNGKQMANTMYLLSGRFSKLDQFGSTTSWGPKNNRIDLDELVWFDRPITTAEVQDLYNCGLAGTSDTGGGGTPPVCVLIAPLGGGNWQVGDSIVFKTNPATLVDWDFGDGNTDSQTDITVHDYQTAGTFQASFTFEGTSYDCPSALQIDDSVLDTNYEVVCALSGLNPPVKTGDSVTASVTLQSNISGTASFDFDDAVVAGAPFSASYTYAAGSTGSKLIRVTFTPDAGTGYGPVTDNCPLINVADPADDVEDPDDEEEDVVDEDDCVFEDPVGDVDGDGVLNGQENRVGTDPCSPDCSEEAAEAFPDSDFDGDGIVNSAELEFGTSPCRPDCNEELAEAFPEADFDGDRVPNIVELEEGSNPCDPESIPG